MDGETRTFDVSIVIPTLARNDDLQRAVASILALPDDACGRAELVIVDNSTNEAARPIVAALAPDASMPIRYVSEPNPGVSNARNAGLAAAHSQLIAFLDDDETAETGWLDGLLTAHKTHDATVVFGPVKTVLPDDVTQHQDYFSRFFERAYDGPEGVMNTYFGCGNSLLDLTRARQALQPGADFFDKRANNSGGEDDALFQQIKQHGGRFVWTRSSVVLEHAPAKRVRLSYTLRRAFAYGQGPSSTCWRKQPPDLPGLIFWMIVGAGQLTVYGTLAGLMWLVRHPRRAGMLDKAVRGLGKLLWFPPFKLALYGEAVANGSHVQEGRSDLAPAAQIRTED